MHALSSRSRFSSCRLLRCNTFRSILRRAVQTPIMLAPIFAVHNSELKSICLISMAEPCCKPQKFAFYKPLYIRRRYPKASIHAGFRRSSARMWCRSAISPGHATVYHVSTIIASSMSIESFFLLTTKITVYNACDSIAAA